MRLVTLLSISLLAFSCNQNHNEVAFLSKDAGIPGLYLMNNEEITLISQPNSVVGTPVLSPDKEKIAYLSEDLGKWDIWVYDLKDKSNTNLTESNQMDGIPSWSPDGKSLAFMSMKDDNRDVYVHSFESNETRRATFNASIDLDPVWSESLENTLYFKSIRLGYESIYMLNMEDSLIGMVSSPGANSSKAETIPSRNKLSYVRNFNGRNTILAYNEESKTNEVLLEIDSQIEAMSWAKQGDHVALDLDGRIEIYIYDQDKLYFVDSIPNAEFPTWSHTDLTLYFNFNDDQGAQIFKYNLLDGSMNPVTPASINAFHPIPLH